MPLTDYYLNVTRWNAAMFGLKAHEIDQHGSSHELSQRPFQWWFNGGNVAQLLRWLHEQEPLEFLRVVEIVEKPWKWDDEWKQMQAESKT